MRVLLGPHEELAKIYVMEKSEAADITPEVGYRVCVYK